MAPESGARGGIGKGLPQQQPRQERVGEADRHEPCNVGLDAGRNEPDDQNAADVVCGAGDRG